MGEAKRRRVALRIGRGVAALAAVAVVLAASLRAAARSGWLHDRVRDAVTSAVARAGLTATFRVSLEPPLRAVLEDVRVSGARPGWTLEAPRVVLTAGLGDALRGKIEVSSIEIDRASIRIEVAAGAARSRRAVAILEEAEKSWPVRHVRLHAATVRVVWAGGGAAVSGVEVQADASASGGSLRARAGHGEVDSSARGTAHRDELCDLEVKLRVVPGAIALDRLALRAEPDARGRACVATGAAPAGAGMDAEIDGAVLAAEGAGRAFDARAHVDVRGPLRVLARAGLARPWGEARVEATVAFEGGVVRVPKARLETAAGPVWLSGVEVRPFAAGAPVRGEIDAGALRFADFLRVLGVAGRPHVVWAFEALRWGEVSGTLRPLSIAGPMAARTGRFAVLDGPYDEKARRRVWSFAASSVAARATLTSRAFVLTGVRAALSGGEARAARVVLGFDDALRVEGASARLDLARVSPVAGVVLGGRLDVRAIAGGRMADPRVEVDGRAAGLVVGGDPLGDVRSVRVRYGRRVLRFEGARLRAGGSDYEVPSLRIAFGGPRRLEVDAVVSASSLAAADLLSLGRLERRRPFDRLAGSLRDARARIRYVVGGRDDPLGRGTLFVEGSSRLARPSAFGARFDAGSVDLAVRWWDRDAGLAGADVELRSLSLRVRPDGGPQRGGGGAVLATGRLAGGAIDASAVVSGVPLVRLGPFARFDGTLRGRVSAVAHAHGTLAAMRAAADVEISPLRARAAAFGSSAVHIEATAGAALDPRLEAAGDLLGGQIHLDELVVSRAGLHGRASLRGLSIAGPLSSSAESAEARGRPGAAPWGRLTISGELAVGSFDPGHVERARARFVPTDCTATLGAAALRVRAGGAAVVLAGDAISVPPLDLELNVSSGAVARASLRGSVSSLSRGAWLDATMTLPPADLSRLVGVVPGLTRARGTVAAQVTMRGPVGSPELAGSVRLHADSATWRWIPSELSAVDADVGVARGVLTLKRFAARIGDGVVGATGRLPLDGVRPGVARFAVRARGVRLSPAPGLEATFDADAGARVDVRSLLAGRPHAVAVDGDIDLDALTDRRAIGGAPDLGVLFASAARARRHDAEPAYDPARDVVDLALRLHARAPVRLEDDVADVSFVPRGPLWLRGTNQRPALLGRLVALRGGRLRLGGVAFDVARASVDFDDPFGLDPRLDVVATTEYRRLADLEAPSAMVSSEDGGASRWRITLTVDGAASAPRLALSSEPRLDQDDIVLMLALGATRAQLAAMQATASPEASAAGLEALADLGGAAKLVRGLLPVDAVGFASEYSSRALRIVPDLTLRKRIGARLAATVTSDLADERDVRGAVEWRLGRDLWVEALWKNDAPVPASPAGDFGAGLRYHLEFR